jgi:hypothetical protein
VERLGLTAKLLHTVQRAGIRTLEDLQRRSPRELALLQGIGPANLAELLSALHPAEFEKRVSCGTRIAHINREIAEHRLVIEALQGESKCIRSGRPLEICSAQRAAAQP